MKTLYVSLWDSMGNEANFPGYTRAACTFDYVNGAFVNSNALLWSVCGASYQQLTEVRLHESMYGPELFHFPLGSPIGSLNSGDTVNFGSSGMHMSMDAGMYKVITRSVEADVVTFEKYLADHPNATQQELWDAAFVAGHQTAHTLLTGEPQ